MPTYTYDPALSTDLDHVRFLVDDTDVSTASSAQLSDEEILAVIAEQNATGKALKYFAAGRCWQVLASRWSSSGSGITEKQVGRLRIKYGIDGSAAEIAAHHAKRLFAKGAMEQTTYASTVFKAL